MLVLEVLVTEFPSPKLHTQLVMFPVETSVKVTVCVTKRFVGVPVKFATGATSTTLMLPLIARLLLQASPELNGGRLVVVKLPVLVTELNSLKLSPKANGESPALVITVSVPP